MGRIINTLYFRSRFTYIPKCPDCPDHFSPDSFNHMLYNFMDRPTLKFPVSDCCVPLAGRLNGSLFEPPECFSKLAAEATLPSYCALNDPHLREYYQRKFSQPLLTASVSGLHGRQVSCGEIN